MIHASIDIETLSLSPSPVILSIGLFAFDPEHLETFENIWMESPRCRIVYPDVQTQINMGRSIDWNTLRWWSEQGPEAMRNAFQTAHENKSSMSETHDQIHQFFKDNQVEGAWGNGKEFDITHVNSLLFESGYARIPIPFWAEYDLRTLAWMSGVSTMPKPKGMIPHHALHDAVWQGLLVQTYIPLIHMGE